jgi:hypothetical protein
MGIHHYDVMFVIERNLYVAEPGILRLARGLKGESNAGQVQEVQGREHYFGNLEERHGNPRKDSLHIGTF